MQLYNRKNRTPSDYLCIALIALLGGCMFISGCGSPIGPDARFQNTSPEGSVVETEDSNTDTGDERVERSVDEDTIIGGHPLTLSTSACQRRAESAWEYLNNCDRAPVDRDTFIVGQIDACRYRISSLAAGLAAGRLSYSGEAERDCYAARERGSCIANYGVSCFARGVDGLAAPGDPCFDSLECDDDHYCVYRDSCPGTCQARAAEGEDCTAKPCPLDQHCNIEGECAPFQVKSIGEICNYLLGECGEGSCRPFDGDTWRCQLRGGQDELCNSSGHCEEGLFCVLPGQPNDGFQVGTCQSSLPEGQACIIDSSCEEGLRCIPNTGDVPNPDIPTPPGSNVCAYPLEPGAECWSSDYLSCDSVNGECHTVTACSEGERCLPDPDGVSSTCGPALAEGEHCSYVGCADGLACNGPPYDLRCLPIPGEGEECYEWGTCRNGLFCNEMSQCEHTYQRGVGQPCPGGEVHYCAEGLFCSNEICYVRMTEGQDCSSNVQCAEGLECRSGQCTSVCKF